MTVDRERSRREGSAQPDEHQPLPPAFEEPAETETQWSRRISGSTGNVGMGAFGVDPAKAAVDIGNSSVSRARCSMGRGVYGDGRSAVGFQRGSGKFHEHLQDDFHRVSLSGGFFGVSDAPGRSLATRTKPALSIVLLQLTSLTMPRQSRSSAIACWMPRSYPLTSRRGRVRSAQGVRDSPSSISSTHRTSKGIGLIPLGVYSEI